MDRQIVEVAGATVPFERYEADGLTYYRFDTTLSECPEPMINAMRGLKLIDSPDKRLEMINMQEPVGLYPRIAGDFTWEVQPLENGDVRILFRLKASVAVTTDFADTHCPG